MDTLFAVAGPTGPRHRGVEPDDHDRDRPRHAPGASTAARPRHLPEGPEPRARVRDVVDASRKVEPFSNALEAAHRTPEIRAALVAEMRELLATGDVGSDVQRLANRLIDSIEDLAAAQLRAGRPSYPRLVASR